MIVGVGPRSGAKDLTDTPAANTALNSPAPRTGLLDRVFNAIPALILAYPVLISPFLLDYSGGDGADNNLAASKSNAVNQLFWIGIFGLTVLTAGRRLKRSFSVLRNPVVWVLLAYLGLALCSVLWSPAPDIAFRRLVQQAIIVLSLVICVSFTDDPKALLGKLVTLMTTVVILNTVAVAVLPPTPLGHAGIYSHKNGLGAVMALAFMINLYGMMVTKGLLKRAGMLVISGLAFGLLVLSQSKTSLGLSVLMPIIAYCLVGMAWLFRMNAAILLLFSMATGIVLWFFVSAVTRFGFSELSLFLFNDETYTGRTVIWVFVLEVISRAPFFGQGYSSFWAIGSDSIVFREAPGFVVSLLQAHNGYLDVMIETGMVGFTVLILMVLVALFSTARAVPLNRQIAFLCYSLMLFVICHNMLESSWFRGYSLNWLIFLIAALLPGTLSRRRD